MSRFSRAGIRVANLKGEKKSCDYLYNSIKSDNSILPTAGGKVKNAPNHRQIDARGEAEDIKPVIYGILYYRRRWVYYFCKDQREEKFTYRWGMRKKFSFIKIFE